MFHVERLIDSKAPRRDASRHQMDQMMPELTGLGGSRTFAGRSLTLPVARWVRTRQPGAEIRVWHRLRFASDHSSRNLRTPSPKCRREQGAQHAVDGAGRR